MSQINVIDMLTEDHRHVDLMSDQCERVEGEGCDRLVHEIIQYETLA